MLILRLRWVIMGFTSEAIKLFNEVRGKLEEALGKSIDKALESLRTRARNTPSLIMTSGLPQTLAYIASKSNGKLYTALFSGGRASGVKDEDAGYTAYLYVIMKFLAKVKALDTEPRSIEEVVKAIEKLDENPQQTAFTQEVLMELLLEFKKIAEALVESK